MNAAVNEGVARSWGWMLAIGVGLLVLGLLAASMAVATTMATIIVLGSLLIIGGIIQVSGAFRCRKSGEFWLHLLGGILYCVFGVLVAFHPAVGGAMLTLVLALLLLVGGIYRVAAASSVRLPNWGWAVASGVIDIVLAVMLFTSWPTSGFWFIGLCIGIALIFQGWSWIMVALLLRKLA